MKLLFLDFDGVLIVPPFKPSGSRSVPKKECIDNLNWIIEETGCFLVVSSAWRIGRNTQELIALLKNWGIVGSIFDTIREYVTIQYTESDTFSVREEEIKQYLQYKPEYNYVILDDAPMYELADRHVRTNFEEGLTKEKAQEVIDKLNENTGNS